MNLETIISMVLTFMIWSYLLGDNPAFRVAEHLLVGVAAGYTVVVAWFQVLQPALQELMVAKSAPAAAVPLVLCLMLMARLRNRWTGVSSVPVALLIGVGAALTVGGAFFGTLWPQASAVAALSLDPSDYGDAQPALSSPYFWQNLAVVIGTIGTFFYFAFNVRPRGKLAGFQEGFIHFWSGVGHWVILITLGALFANAAMSRLSLLIGRLDWLLGAFGWR